MNKQVYFRSSGEDDYFMYTDLALERRRADLDCEGIEFRSYESDGGSWECIKILSDEAAMNIGRPIGIYDTLSVERMDLLTESEIDDATEEVARKLCEIFDTDSIFPERILVVGLGNRALTPDSVGPKSAEAVKPTLHISTLDEDFFYSLECSEIAVICPGVLATSGMDTTEIIKGIARRINPDAIIAIDSIASRSTERLGTTIQISNTGIFPGSGIGNRRQPLNEETLGAPVIAIGVPTVIDSRVFAKDVKDSMIVSPKEIDEITDAASRIIGGAINQAFGISVL